MHGVRTTLRSERTDARIASLSCLDVPAAQRSLLRENLIDSSASAITDKITSGIWGTFDDVYALGLIRALRERTSSPITKRQADSVLDRNPPRMVAQLEYIGPRTTDAKKEFLFKYDMITRQVHEWATKTGIDVAYWYTWSLSGMALTKIGSTVPVSAAGEVDEDKVGQAIRIFDERSKLSVPVSEVRGSLMSVLADRALYSARVYVLLDKTEISRKAEIEKYVRGSLSDIGW